MEATVGLRLTDTKAFAILEKVVRDLGFGPRALMPQSGLSSLRLSQASIQEIAS
jgi:hypothetical protein